MKKSSKSLLAVVLSVIMVLSMTTVAMFSVFADDAKGGAEPTTAEAITAEPATGDEETTVPQPPVTDEPATDEETTVPQPPVTDKPITEPVTDEPATVPPVTEEPITEPVTDEPATVPQPLEILGLVGDMDNNGKVNSADARLVLRLCAKLDDPDVVAPANGVDSALYLFKADANGDALVKSEDARQLLRAAAKLDLDAASAKRVGHQIVLDGVVSVVYDDVTV